MLFFLASGERETAEKRRFENKPFEYLRVVLPVSVQLIRRYRAALLLPSEISDL